MLSSESANCRLVGNRRINDSVEDVYEERHKLNSEQERVEGRIPKNQESNEVSEM